MSRSVVRCLFRVYQLALSPFLKWVATGNPKGATCRFHPSCSNYGLQAVDEHGTLRGLWLTLRRLSRCHPWGGHGADPVPPSPGSCRPSHPISYESSSD